ncbi:MAG: hypothetical protein ACYS67_10865 [Planctomycetota bacterium]
MQVAYGEEYLAWYKLEKNESIFDVLHHCGLPLEKIWDDPDNKKLKENRKSPFWIQPPDEIRVPKKEIKVETEKTEKLYRYQTTNKHIPLIDVYLGFMDEEVNARLERLIDSQKDKDKDARPVILIERGKLDLKSPILEWRIGNYKIDPTRIINVSPNGKTTHEKGSAQGGSEAPENILAQAMTVFMEYDLASDLDWLARGLKVKRYFDLMKLLQHRGHPKTKSRLPSDATGKGPWLSVVRFGIGKNENAPIIVIRTPEMGLQPSLMCPYLAFLFKAISAMSSQLAHENKHKWEWPLRVSQFGAQGSSSSLGKYQPGGLVENIFASLYVGVEIASDVTVTAKDKSGGKLKATFEHSRDGTDAAPHRKAKDMAFDSQKQPKQYEDIKQEAKLRTFAVISLCTPACVHDLVREEISKPKDVRDLIDKYNLTGSLVQSAKKDAQKTLSAHPKPKNIDEVEKAQAETGKAIEVLGLRRKELADLQRYAKAEELDPAKKCEVAQLLAGAIFRWSWNSEELRVRQSKFAKGSPFYQNEQNALKDGSLKVDSLKNLLTTVRDVYKKHYPDGEISLTGSYFFGEDDKAAADILDIHGVNMEDYHVLRVLRSALAKGVSKDSDYPIIMKWRIDRINCDPKELNPLVLEKFNEFIKKPQLTLDGYIKVIQWGLGGVLKSEVPECAHWGLVDAIRNMKSEENANLGEELLHQHLWSFVQEGGSFIVPDPFCIEIATDFVNELAEIKATEQERTKDGNVGPAGGIAGIENKVSVEQLTKLRSLANAVRNACSGEVETRAKELMTFLKDNCSFDAGEGKLKTWLRPGKWGKDITAPTLQDLSGQKFGGAAVDRAFYKSCNMMALQTMAHKYFFE